MLNVLCVYRFPIISVACYFFNKSSIICFLDVRVSEVDDFENDIQLSQVKVATPFRDDMQVKFVLHNLLCKF
jgi:hypothetical protein